MFDIYTPVTKLVWYTTFNRESLAYEGSSPFGSIIPMMSCTQVLQLLRTTIAEYNIITLCLVIIRLRLECCLLMFVGEISTKCEATHWDEQCGNGFVV